ncbi:Sll1483 [Caligus rogercresseyi]|uniref:Sll1483 n=1 Tax=Caligus rogercresseyi TaxID=217165 RepID=A0A7T8KHT5_CALRO|nr:Sll1483 [Caligus rogercresseyi]
MKITAIFAFVLISASGIDADCNLVNTLVGIDQFSGLVAAVKAAGLVDVLLGDGPFTVFAPSDRVFNHLPASALIGLASDPEALKTVLLRHVVPGQMIMSKDIPDGETVLPTAAPGENVTVMKQSGRVMVKTSAGAAYVVYPDIVATNGVVHKISGLI